VSSSAPTLGAYYLSRAVPLWVFEMLCLPVLALAATLSARRVGARAFAVDYACLALAGLLGEASSIAWYRYYGYANGWHLHVLGVPALVPLIWPLVILSAREVRAALFPDIDPLRGALVVCALVIADASMVEVLAVRAQLWSWAEDGHLGVPLLGIVAWGYFAGAADLAMTRFRGRERWLVVPVALALAHGLIVLSWWSLFRWVLRGGLGWGSLAVLASLSLAATAVALSRRRRGYLIPIEVAIPRMIAASLFGLLFVLTAPTDLGLLAHVTCIAIPYFAASMLSRRGRDGAAARALDPQQA
jgi:hypothetical protein